MGEFSRRDALKMAALAVPGMVVAGKAFGQDTWPERPVHVIMGFGPGGAADTIARAVFQVVSQSAGQPMVVENRTGGNSVIAAQAVLQRPADGHVFLLNGLQQIVNPMLVEDLPLDYDADFVPVTKLCIYPQVFAVGMESPWQTMQDFIDDARANPGTITYGTPGIGGIPTILGELLQLETGIELANVPYTSAPDMAADVGGGRLDMCIMTTSTIAPMYQAGRVRILAIGNPTRSELHPDVPTMEEVGLPEVNLTDWSGLFAPTGTPQSAIEQFQSHVAEAAHSAEVRQRLAPLGTIPVASTPEEFQEFVTEHRQLVARVIDAAGIRLE